MEITSTELISISDAYCVYNKTRGFEFVSPVDILTICSVKFKELNIPLQFKRLKSGLCVIHRETITDDILMSRVLDALQETQFITAISVNLKGINSALLGDLLYNMELMGLLLRDEAISGVRFYENKIFKI